MSGGGGGVPMMTNSAAAAYHHQTQLIGSGSIVGGFGSPIGGRPLITAGGGVNVGNGDHHHLQQIATSHPADPTLLHDYHSL